MLSRKKSRIKFIVFGMILLVLATLLIGVGMREGIEFFKSPSQVYANPPMKGTRFRLGGLVEESSLMKGNGEVVSFKITDNEKSIAVVYSGVLPDLFKEKQGVIALGSIQSDGIFSATEILAKHDEDYLPKEIVETLKEQGVYVEPEDK
jgi:cytochrome c-type biogenesis protein CcmE